MTRPKRSKLDASRCLATQDRSRFTGRLGIRAVLTVWALSAAALFSGCNPSDDRATSDTPQIQRIILISIDTLRADGLGSYGNESGASPNLDRFAEQGVRFETCIAPAPITLPSHATLLTGLHPLEHGLVVNAQSALAPDIPTLAETLQAEGWKTGAVVSSDILHHRYGLDRGFSYYDDDQFPDTVDPSAPAMVSANARDATLAAINWLTAQPLDERLFLFLHYIDPHAPYSAPRPFAKAFPDDPYQAEIAYTDEWIGKLAGFLQENGLIAGTLFVIVADHGEHLGQHGVPSHGYFVYDEVLRVPLIFAGAGLPAGVTRTDPVGLIDVVPTILSLLKLPALPNLSGRDILAPPDETASERPIISISYEPASSFGWSPLWSLSLPGEKFILAPTPEYYLTDSDPGELDNVAAQHPDRVRELEKALREKASDYLSRNHEAVPVGLDMATAEQLVALGYAAPVQQEGFALDDFSGRDPKEMREVILRMDDYHTAVVAEDYEGASAILDEVQKLDPEMPLLREERSLLFLLRGQEVEFLQWIDEMPSNFQANPVQRYRRAVALGRLGRGEEAMSLLRETLAQMPDDSGSRFELANQLTLSGQPEEAMREYRELLRSDPSNRGARLNYASLLKKSGDRLAAIAELRILVEAHPSYAKAFRNLGLDLAGIGDRQGAIAMLKHAIALAPDAANRRRTEQIIEELRAGS